MDKIVRYFRITASKIRKQEKTEKQQEECMDPAGKGKKPLGLQHDPILA